jgi:hypothetical protein
VSRVPLISGIARRLVTALPPLCVAAALTVAIGRFAAGHVSVQHLKQARTLHAAVSDAPTVVLAFQARDCLLSREQLRSWTADAQRQGQRVIGVPIGDAAGRATTSAALADAGLVIPLEPALARAAERIGLHIGHARTPYVLRFEAGRLVSAEGAIEN